MKKNVQKMKMFALALGLVLVFSGVNAQRVATQSGLWTSATTWGGQQPPTAAQTVVINDGINVQVNTAAECASLTINGGGTATTLTINTNQSLTTGAIVINAGTDGSSERIVNFNSGSVVTCTSLTLGNPDFLDDPITINISTGRLDVNGNITMNGGSGENVINVPANGRVETTGSIAGGTLTVANLSTIAYDGGAQTVRAMTYGNLELSGSGLKTITGVQTNDNFIFGGTATLSGAMTYSSCILHYEGTSAQVATTNEFPANSAQLTGVVINNPFGVSITAGKTLNGDLTITQGTFAAGNNLSFGSGPYDLTIAAGTFTGTPQGGNDYNVIYTGNSKTTGTELSGAELDDISVNLTAGQTLTLSANRTPDDDIAVNSGTFDLGAFTLNSGAATQSFTVASGATLRIGGTNSLPTGYNYTFGATSRTDFYGGAQVINAATYGHLDINGTSLADLKTTGGAITIVGDFHVGGGANLALGANNISMSASGDRLAWLEGQVNINGNGRLTQTGSGNKTFRLGTFGGGVPGLLYLTDVGNATTIMPIFDIYDMESNSVVYYASTDNQAILGGIQYGNLVAGLDGLGGIPGSGIKTVTSSLEVINSVVINPGVTLTCEAGGANADNIRLGGTWLNAGTFVANDDQVIFDGSSTQELRGPNVTTFNNLRLFKDDADFGMRLLVNAIVTGQMTFERGFFETQNASVLIMNAGSTVSAAPAPSDASYAACPVRKIGATAFTFPVGRAGQYSPVTITAPGEAGDAFQAEFRRSSASALGPVPPNIGISNVSNCEYWVLDEVADPGNNNSISMTVGWDNQSQCGSSYITNVAALTLAHFNTATQQWDTWGGTPTGNTTTGSITRTGITVFSPFSLANTLSGANPLPVKFSLIKAYEKQSGIQIDWTSYDEHNVDEYQIERSADGQHFTSIGTVNALNNSTDIKYGFFDANPLAGVSFYRVKNVDLDSKSGLSNVVRVDLDKNVKDIRVYPNPVRGGAVSIQSADLAKGSYAVTVYNAAGQQVTSKQFTHNGGYINQPITLPAGSQSGMYMLHLESNGVRVMAKTFVVQQ